MLNPEESASLRQRAEEIAQEKVVQSADTIEALSLEETRHLVHELRVHQIELEMQNDELRRAQAELGASQARYFDLYDFAPVGYLILSEKGLILETNLTAATLLGVARGAMVQQMMSQFILEEDQQIYYRIRNQLSKTGEPQACELRMIKMDGAAFCAQLEVTAEHIVDGTTVGRVVMTDITERKRIEDNLRQTQKMEAIGQLAGGVAHDFNNNMAATMMQLSFLRMNKSLDLEAQETVYELMAGAKRAASLTSQLLIFSRKSVLEIKVLDLSEVVSNLLKMLGRLIGEHISIQFEICDALPAVEADAGMMEQVVMNLALNARDAMPKGGRLTINLESIQIDAQRVKGKIGVEPGLFVCLSVADTGCGMDKATRQRIFEPFFTTKEVGKGTGMGLATVHGIVAQHKGWVDVESEIGKGTTVKVFLPATTQGMGEQKATEKTAVIRGHETILLVEDEASLRRLVAQGLRQLGYRVLEADNGQTAMKLWEHGQHIDLLFSDMVMPEGFTGLDLAEKLRQEKPILKVIISSGYNVETAGQGRPGAGGIVYFQKPYEFEELSKTVRDCLDRA